MKESRYKRLDKIRRRKQGVFTFLFIAVILGGWHFPIIGYFVLLCMLLGIGIGIFRGRKWCDWYCPRGSFYDYLGKKVSPERKIPSFFKGLPLRVSILSFLMAMMSIQLLRRWPNPYTIGMFFVMLLTVTTIIGVVLALLFHQRSWCCFCPVGSIGNWLDNGNNSPEIVSDSCNECGVCARVCPIQVIPYSYKTDKEIEKIKESDCIKCGLCVSACPKNALKVGD